MILGTSIALISLPTGLIASGFFNLEEGSQLAGIGQLVMAVVATHLAVLLAPRRRAPELHDAYHQLRNTVSLDSRDDIRRLTVPGGRPIDLAWVRPPPAEPAATPGPAHPPVGRRPSGTAGHAGTGTISGLRAAWRHPNPGRLVITGAPGSGKTTLAMLLVEDLLTSGTPGTAGHRPDDWQPVPVPVSLASWDPEASFVAWLAEQLTVRYQFLSGPPRRRTRLATELVRHGLVLPVLDALDTLSKSKQDNVIKKLSTPDHADRPLILTCRTADYQRYLTGSGPTLAAADVLELEPASLRQARSFLWRVEPLAGDRWRTVLDHIAAHPGEPLATVMANPLMLTLAAVGYRSRAADGESPAPHPDELTDRSRFSDVEHLREHLFAGYVSAVYPAEAEDDGWSAEQAAHWLGFFARLRGQDPQNSQESGFGWWHLRSAVPRWFLGGVVGGGTGLAYGAVAALGDRVGVGAGVGLLPGIVLGLLVAWPVRRLAERLRRRAARSGTRPRRDRPNRLDSVSGLLGGLSGGLLGALAAGFLGRHHVGYADGWTAALPGALGVGIWLGPAVGLFGALAGSAAGGCVAAMLTERLQGWPAGIATGLAVAIAVAVAVSLPGERPPAGGVRWSKLGLFSAGTVALVVGAATAAAAPGPVALVTGLAAGAVTALAGGVTEAVIDLERTMSQAEAVRLDRRAFMIVGSAYGISSFLVAGAVAGLANVLTHHRPLVPLNLLRFGAATGVVVGLGLGLVFAFRQTAWGSYVLAQVWLVRRKLLPPKPLVFLADANERGVLGRAGAVYRFRHSDLRRHLARIVTRGHQL